MSQCKIVYIVTLMLEMCKLTADTGTHPILGLVFRKRLYMVMLLFVKSHM